MVIPGPTSYPDQIELCIQFHKFILSDSCLQGIRVDSIWLVTDAAGLLQMELQGPLGKVMSFSLLVHSLYNLSNCSSFPDWQLSENDWFLLNDSCCSSKAFGMGIDYVFRAVLVCQWPVPWFSLLKFRLDWFPLLPFASVCSKSLCQVCRCTFLCGDSGLADQMWNVVDQVTFSQWESPDGRKSLRIHRFWL